MADDVAEIPLLPRRSVMCARRWRKKASFISCGRGDGAVHAHVLTDPDAIKNMGLLLDHLEDDDDVQNVWHNLENEEDWTAECPAL